MPEAAIDAGAPQDRVQVQTDQVYRPGQRPLHWDVYRPSEAGATPLPAVLLLHGGGWRNGDKAAMAAAATLLAGRGFVALAVEYRLLPEAAWPAPLDDVGAAISGAVRQAGALGVDPSQIFLLGYSAGGHLALLAAAQPDAPPVAGVASFFAPTRLTAQHAGMLGVTPSALEALSPLSFADRMPPAILFAGDGDRQVPSTDAVEFHAELRAAGRIADLRLYSGLIHEFVQLPGMMQITLDDAVAFFRRCCIDRAAFAEAEARLEAWWKQMLGGAPK